MSELTLGTAQWGSAYGQTNAKGRLDSAEVNQIAMEACHGGVAFVDTALDYGDAHERLRPFAQQFLVTTKVSGSTHVQDQVDRALEELGIPTLWGLLIHDWDQLTGAQRLTAAEQVCNVDRSHALRVGVSVYTEDAVVSAVNIFSSIGYTIDLVQVPASVVDQRLDESLVLSELATEGACIQVRSAFLQGVLLSPSSNMARHPDIDRFHREVSEWAGGSSVLDVCLGHLKSLNWMSQVIVGVTSSHELSQVVQSWSRTEPRRCPPSWGSSDLALIDPRRWSVAN